MTAAQRGPFAAWTTTLDDLEADVAAVEASLDAGAPVAAVPWAPPTHLGPLPEPLRERASDLLARLQDAADELRAASTESLGAVERTQRRRAAATAYQAAGPAAG